MGAKIKTLLCLGLGMAVAGPAAAQERLTMPFSCRVGGGTVLLAPAAPQTYEIYGSREKRRITTCSPYDPRNCHTWFVYRFDLDCGGRRTSWEQVVAALSQKFADAPATRENAHVGRYGDARRIPPWAQGGRAYRHGVSPGVDFPPGFAPNPLKVAKFEQTRPTPAPVARPLKKPVPTPPVETAEVAPQPAAPSPSAPNSSAASPSGPSSNVTKPTSTAAPSEPSTKPDTANVADAAKRPAPAETKPAKAADPEPQQIALVTGKSEATGSLGKSGTGSTLWRDAAMVFTVTLAVLLALTALLVLRRRGIETMPAPFAGRPLKRTIHDLFTRTSYARPEASTGEKGAGETGLPSTGLRLWDEDWLPATKSEALEVLGVDPGANTEAMKVTVKRLRRALHPDHAIDDEDLALRERRLKQINVAWDIVSGKRRAS